MPVHRIPDTSTSSGICLSTIPDTFNIGLKWNGTEQLITNLPYRDGIIWIETNGLHYSDIYRLLNEHVRKYITSCAFIKLSDLRNFLEGNSTELKLSTRNGHKKQETKNEIDIFEKWLDGKD